MPNMALQNSRQMAGLILQGMLSDSTELRETIIYRLTPKQLKTLAQISANIRHIEVWQQKGNKDERSR